MKIGKWLSTLLEDGGPPEYSKYMAAIWIQILFYYNEITFSCTNINNSTLRCKKSAKKKWKTFIFVIVNLVANPLKYIFYEENICLMIDT